MAIREFFYNVLQLFIFKIYNCENLIFAIVPYKI